MNDKKYYSVSELAGLVGVPRTTINDWLSRYNDYLDSELRGKRRVYSDRTVTVLKEIAALRESGRNGFEIDQALAERHPVNPEVAPAAEPAAADAPRPEGVSALDEPPAALPAVSADPDAALPAARQLTEAGRQFAEELRQVVAALKTQHEETRRLLAAARRRNRRLVIAGIAVLALIATGIFFAVRDLQSSYAEHESDMVRQWNSEMEAARSSWNDRQVKLEQEARAWEARRQEDLENERKRSAAERTAQAKIMEQQQEKNAVERQLLMAELEKQKIAFQTRMEELRKNLSSQTEAQMMQLRDDFAKHQLEYLKELEALRASNTELARAATQAAMAVRENAVLSTPSPAQPAQPIQPIQPVQPIPSASEGASATASPPTLPMPALPENLPADLKNR